MIKKILISVFGFATLFGGVALNDAFTPIETKISREQDTYLKQHGKYSNDTRSLPENCKMDEYVAPKGVGWQVTCETDAVISSWGEGPEAEERTYTIPKHATST